MAALRIVVADDHVLLREGLVRLLEEAGLEVVAQAGDAPSLIAAVDDEHPDVAIVDVQMPPDRTDDGLRAARHIREHHPDVGVLVLTQFLEERYALDLVGDDASGVGYLLKDRVGDVASLVDSVKRVAAGGTALDPDVVARMVGRRRKEDPLEHLTPREREVLALMAEGKSNHGIAEELSVTPAAIEKHITSIFQTLDLGRAPTEHRRVHAVLTLLRSR